MTLKFLKLAAFTALILFESCASRISQKNPETLPSSLVSIYLVTQMRMNDGSDRDVHDLKMILEIQSQNRIMGNSSCNDFTGNYSYENAVLNVTQMLQTEMSCGPEKDLIERRYFQILSQELRAVSEPHKILLYGKDEKSPLLELKKIDE